MEPHRRGVLGSCHRDAALPSRASAVALSAARAAPSRFREAKAGPRRAASAARAAARRRRQARRGEALRRGGRCRTAEARATRGAAATPRTAPARAAAAQAVALPISGASERARASRRVCPVRRVRHGWRGGGAALCVCYAVARHLLPPTRKTSSRWTADVGLARATRGRLESPGPSSRKVKRREDEERGKRLAPEAQRWA